MKKAAPQNNTEIQAISGFEIKPHDLTALEYHVQTLREQNGIVQPVANELTLFRS